MTTHIILFISCIGFTLLQFAGANELKSYDFDFNMEYYDSKANANLADSEHLETAINTMLHAAQEKSKLEDKNKVKGIWFIVHPEQAAWITLLFKHDFRFHLAVDESLKMHEKYTNVVIMKKSFLPPNLDTVPLPAFTTIGLGAVVLHQTDSGNSPAYEILLQERKAKGQITSTSNVQYLLPGTSLKPGETIEEGIKRALDGIVDKPVFHGIVEIKHLPNEGVEIRSKGDMMIYCIVTVATKSDHKDYKWKPRHELNEKMAQKPEGQPDAKTTINTGNWNAILAADGWHAQWKNELANKSNKLELFFKDPKTESSITYAFYRKTEDWEKITGISKPSFIKNIQKKVFGLLHKN